MKKISLKIVLFIFLFTVVCGVLQAGECSVTKKKWKNFDAYEMENKYVRILVIPKLKGLVAQYDMKDPDINLFSRLIVKNFKLFSINLNKTNFVGYEDWIKEMDNAKTSINYQCSILEDSPGRCTLLLSYKGANFEIDRKMILEEGSAEIKIEIALKNLRSENTGWSLWGHLCGISLGGAEKVNASEYLACFVPAAPCDEEKFKSLMDIKNVTRNNFIFPERKTIVRNRFKGGCSKYFLPAQAWMGYVNSRNKVCLAAVMRDKEIAKDGLFFIWAGREPDLGEGTDRMLYSMETLWDTVQFKPGDTGTYNITYACAKGLENLCFAGKNVLIGCEGSFSKGLKLKCAFQREMKGITLEFSAFDKNKKLLGTVHKKLEFAVPYSNEELLLELNGQLCSGLMFRMKNANGEVLEDASILKPEWLP